MNELIHGHTYLYQVWSSVTNLKKGSTCVTSVSLSKTINGKKTILDSHEIAKYACGTGGYWIYAYTGKPVPDHPGAATLTGTVKFGTTTVNFDVPVYIK